jgi:hypothetical protein
MVFGAGFMFVGADAGQQGDRADQVGHQGGWAGLDAQACSQGWTCHV